MIENKLSALAYKALKVLGFEVWFWNGCGPSPRFLNVFGINAKFLWRKSISILPYFCGKNLATPRLRCIIAHKMLFSPSLHCKNIATGCLIFTVKMRQSFAFGALWRTGRVLRLCIHCALTAREGHSRSHVSPSYKVHNHPYTSRYRYTYIMHNATT